MGDPAGTVSPAIFLEEILVSETMWNAVVDYLAHMIQKLKRAKEVRRGFLVAWICQAPNSQTAPREIMLEGGFAR